MSRSFVVNTFSYIWTHPVGDCLAALADNGHLEFEVLLTAPHLWPSELDGAARRALRRWLLERGARIVSLNAGGFDNNLASPARNVRAFAQQYLRETVDLAADLGAGDVVVAPGMGRGLLPPARESMLGWFRDGLADCSEHARRRDIRLLVENVPFSFLPAVGQILDAIAELPSERVGIVYDVANAAFIREDPVAGLELACERIGLIHLSDTPLDAWRHDAVGRGVVPFARFGAALERTACCAPLVLEIVSPAPEQDLAASIAGLTAMGY